MKSSTRLPSRPAAEAPGGLGPDSPKREELVVIGLITRPQALKGCFRVKPEVDDLALLQPGRQLWTSARGAALERFEVEQVEIRRNLVVLKVKGIDSIEQAERFRGQLLYLSPEELPELPEDSFYYYRMEGCKVILPDQSTLGEIKEVRPGASGDLIVVRQGEEEVLIPAVKEFVKSVELTSRTVEVDLPEGFL